MKLQQIALNYLSNKTDENFKLLYNRIKPGLKKYISQFLTNKYNETIEEIFSRTIYKAFKNLHQYDTNYNFSTWIYRIARNECLQEIQRKKRIIYFSQIKNSDDEPMDPIYLKNILNKENYITYIIDNEELDNKTKLYNLAINEINNLDDLYKNILIDREIHKMKYEELAKKYNLNLSTLKSRIRLGRLKLRKMLNKYRKILDV